MEKAKKLIRTAADLKLYEIANMLGFSVDATYFSQSFYKYTGMLPSEFRQMAQNQKTNKGI
jgi:YesN/AraC family two-component response regulator